MPPCMGVISNIATASRCYRPAFPTSPSCCLFEVVNCIPSRKNEETHVAISYRTAIVLQVQIWHLVKEFPIFTLGLTEGGGV